MQRNTWVFLVTTSRLMEAISDKVEHHGARRAYWRQAE